MRISLLAHARPCGTAALPAEIAWREDSGWAGPLMALRHCRRSWPAYLLMAYCRPGWRRATRGDGAGKGGTWAGSRIARAERHGAGHRRARLGVHAPWTRLALATPA